MSRRHRYKTALPHRPRRSRCSCPARLHRKRPIGTPRPWRRWRRAVASTTQSRNHTHIRQRRESAVATRLALAKAATLARGGIGSVVTTHVIYWARNSLAEFVLLWKDFAAPSAATPLAGAVTGRIAAERSPIRARNAVTLGAIGVPCACNAEGRFFQHHTQAGPVAAAGTRLARRPRRLRNRSAISLYLALAEGLTVERQLRLFQFAALRVETRASQRRARRVGGRRRAGPHAASDVAGGAQLRACAGAASAIYALARRNAVGIGGTGRPQCRRCYASTIRLRREQRRINESIFAGRRSRRRPAYRYRRQHCPRAAGAFERQGFVGEWP